MRKILFILLVLPCLFFAQQIHFDYFVEEEHSRKGVENWLSNYLINTSTKQRLNITNKDGKLEASYYDKTLKRRHDFDVIKNSEGFLFYYERTLDYKNFNSEYEKKYGTNKKAKKEFVRIDKKADLLYEIGVYKKPSSKRPLDKVIVELEKFDKNYINFWLDNVNQEEMIRVLQNKINSLGCCCYIKSYDIHYSPYLRSKVEIRKMEKVDFTIEIPKKLNIIDYDGYNN